MKALAISGSPRADGNTDILMKRFLDKIGDADIDGEFLALRDVDVQGCTGCAGCWKDGDAKCVVDDDFNDVFAKMLDADIIVVGSPVYFGSATPEIMALLDRAGFVSKGNGGMLARKVGGAVAVARRAGQNFTFGQLAYWFLINDMIMPGSTYWNVAFGLKQGDVENDEEGLATIDRFAENCAWVARRLAE